VPGSFRSAVGATGAPNATAVFSGVCYIHEALANPPTNSNVVVEARDITSGEVYVRTKTAGAWSAWKTERATIYAAPYDALAYNGMQVNGSMDVSQEFGVSGTTSTNAFVCDGWRIYRAGTMVTSAAQVASSITSGFPYFLSVGVTTAQTSLGASDLVQIYQNIEGYRIARLGWGTANAQPITIGFWSGHHRAGTYSVCIQGTSRGYATTYTQNVGDVAEYKTITIPGDVTGTWATGNTTGMTIVFAMAAGSGTIAGAANTWYAGGPNAAPGQVNGVAATSDQFRLTGVVVLPGIEAPSAAQSPLIMRPFDQELLTCRRYWQKSYNYDVALGAINSAGAITVNTGAAGPYQNVGWVTLFPEIRGTPTLLLYNPATGTFGAGTGTPIRNTSNSTNLNAIVQSAGAKGFQIVADATSVPAQHTLATHYIADGRL
jgi:hypothetical protein